LFALLASVHALFRFNWEADSFPYRKKMFVGHYSVAFAAKTERNKIPLWVLFVAVQFLDYVWATLVLLGIEKMRVVPGFMAGSMIDAYYMPYSHSLIAAIVWSGVAAAIYKAGWRAKASPTAALIVALAVFSHWILDLIVHRPELAIYDDTWKVGLGFWNHRGLEFGLEMVILVVGILLYLWRNTLPGAQRWAVIAFGLMLIVVQVGDTFVPRSPLSDKMTAMGVWTFYTIFVGLAFLLEKAPSSPQASSCPESLRDRTRRSEG
jgi:membrane-bound metal-dependent hydrolase YbcI (DUF457 family)